VKGKSRYYCCLASAVLLGFVGTAGAIALTGVPLGTAAPPTTLGTWSMTAVGADPSALDSFVTSDGLVAFNQAVRHDRVGNGWGTWSHGYAGDVYDTGSSRDLLSLTLTLGANVHAFYFYAESVNFANFTFTATTLDGTTVSQIVNGNGGASGFGFYTTGLDSITSVTVTGTDSDGFGIGEFGVNGNASVPEAGSTLVYASLGLLGLLSCRFVFRGQTQAPVAKI
jgi:hypothetical protein